MNWNEQVKEFKKEYNGGITTGYLCHIPSGI